MLLQVLHKHETMQKHCQAPPEALEGPEHMRGQVWLCKGVQPSEMKAAGEG